MLSCRGGGKLSRPVYPDPQPPEYQRKVILLILLILNYLIVKMHQLINYKHNSSQIQLFSLSHCSICLVAWVGDKLSRPFYHEPNPPEYQSKIV